MSGQRSSDGDGCGTLFGALLLLALVYTAISALVEWLRRGDNLEWTLVGIGWVVWAIALVLISDRPKPQQVAPAPLMLAGSAVSLVVAVLLVAYGVMDNIWFWATFIVVQVLCFLLFTVGLSLVMRLAWHLPNAFRTSWWVGSMVSATLLAAGALVAVPGHEKQERRAEERGQLHLDSARQAIRKERLSAARRQLAMAERVDPDAPDRAVVRQGIRRLAQEYRTYADAEAAFAEAVDYYFEPRELRKPIELMESLGHFRDARRRASGFRLRAARILIREGRDQADYAPDEALRAAAQADRFAVTSAADRLRVRARTAQARIRREELEFEQALEDGDSLGYGGGGSGYGGGDSFDIPFWPGD